MNFSTNDTLTLAHILRDVAKAEIMPRWRSLSEGQIRQKSSAFDLVTDADEAAERAIAAKLAEVFPGAATIGEESCEKNPALLDTIGDHDLAFIVDPVDGTANFAAGLPLFGVICAVVCKGVVAAGVIFDPLGDDWAIAVKGQGAWYESLAGKRRPLRVAQPAPVNAMLGSLSQSYAGADMRARLGRNQSRVAATVGYRCAAHEYRLLASGNMHFSLAHKLMPWDHAAGWLLHREAGGYSARFDGSDYSPLHRDGGLLCAPDRTSWQALYDALIKEEA